MRKQYMDFVPSKSGAKKTVRPVTPSQPKVVRASKPAGTHAVRANGSTGVRAAKVKTAEVANASDKVSFVGEKGAKLGEIENLNTRFVNPNVPKRPLNAAPHFTVVKTEVAKAKSQRVIDRERGADEPKAVQKDGTSKEYKVPKTPFINQDKVQKRPLSKNVYQKKEVKPKDEKQAPVTIIAKPEKQAHAGMIVTIILTIILGAAAGTVAFLLLPK